MEHSKLPWKEGPYGGIYPAGDNPPAITLMSHKDGSFRRNAKANAAFIVKACNEYDTLKAKIELYEKALEKIRKHAYKGIVMQTVHEAQAKAKEL